MVGKNPSDIQINQATNKIYVANSGSNTVSVIDGNSGTLKTIQVGLDPLSIAICGNKIYVTNGGGSNTVSVIDSDNDSKIKDITLGSQSWGRLGG